MPCAVGRASAHTLQDAMPVLRIFPLERLVDFGFTQQSFLARTNWKMCGTEIEVFENVPFAIRPIRF